MRGGTIEMVFFDIGGVMYSDAIYREALKRALRELGGAFADDEFEDAYEHCRREQSGSFRRFLTTAFLGPDASVDDVQALAAQWWAYPPEALEPDVRPCLEALTGRYRLGVIANQPSHVRDAMARDGLDRFFEIWGVSDDVGFEKPDPRLYAHVLYQAGVSPPRSVMLGDRLDYDVLPAKRTGMHAIWVLRGEAPREPTLEQRSLADAAVPNLERVPTMLESWTSPSAAAGS